MECEWHAGSGMSNHCIIVLPYCFPRLGNSSVRHFSGGNEDMSGRGAPTARYLYNPTCTYGAFRYFQCIVIDKSDHSIWQATCDDAIITNCHHDECASTSSECTIYTAPWASRSKMATLDCAGPSIVTPDTVSCACTGVHKRILIDTGCTQPHWFIRQFTAAWCECACVGTAYDALTARGW
mgnify:CR=1 FL=1